MSYSPRRRQAKGEVITQGHLNTIQKEIDRSNSEIESIRQKIENHLKQRENLDQLQRQDEEKIKRVEMVKKMLSKYGKEISYNDFSSKPSTPSKRRQMPLRASSSPVVNPSQPLISPTRTSSILHQNNNNNNNQTIIVFTREKFENKQKEIDGMDEDIQRLKEMLSKVQSQAAKTKNIIQSLNLQIPEFKNDLDKLKYRNVFDQTILNQELLKKINSIKFYEDDLKQRQSKIQQLKKEIQDLQPRNVSLKLLSQSKNNISIQPSSEMSKLQTFEEKKIEAGMKKIAPVLEKAKNNRVSNVFKILNTIKEKLNDTVKSVDQIQKFQPNRVTVRLLKSSASPNLVNDKMNLMNELKARIEENRKQLDAFKLSSANIPKLGTATPEGLLKWRGDLIKQIGIERTKYEGQIQTAKNDYKNYEVISKRKIATLQRTVNEQNAK